MRMGSSPRLLLLQLIFLMVSLVMLSTSPSPSDETTTVVIENRFPAGITIKKRPNQNANCLHPLKPNLTIGKTYKFTCTLRKKFVKRKHVNASSIFFELQPKGNVPPRSLDRDWVHVVNATQALLWIPRVTPDYDSAFLMCHVRHNATYWRLMSSEILHAGDAPRQPVITHVINRNGKQLEFTFNGTEAERGYRNKYQAWYDHNRMQWKKCPNMENYKCIISDFSQPSHGLYAMKVNVTNKFGSNESPIEVDSFHDKLKPGIVKDMNRVMMGNDAYFNWSSPYFYEELDYEISNYSQWNTHPNITITSQRFHFEWLGLQPYTFHSVCVRCKPKYNKGYWSEEKCINFTTPQDNPAVSPLIFNGSFESKPSQKSYSDPTSREIVIHWQRLSKLQLKGKFVAYRVQYVEHGQLKVFEEEKNTSWYRLENMRPNVSYDIMIAAKNEKGFSPENLIHVPSSYKEPQIPKNVTVISQGPNKLHIYWSKLDFFNPMDTISVFWCLRARRPHECAAELMMQTAQFKKGFLEINLPNGYIASEILVGVSRRQGSMFSGIEWQNCRYNSRAVPERPRVETAKNLTNGVHLTITPPTCDTHLGFVYAYNISYCQIISAESTDCIGEKTNIIQERGNGEKYRLEDLDARSFYRIRVTSIATNGSSHAYASVVIKTTGMEPWLMWVIAISISIVLVFVAAGVFACYKCNVKLIRWCRTCMHLSIETPDDTLLKDLGSRESPLGDEDEEEEISKHTDPDPYVGTNGGPTWRPSPVRNQPPLPPIPTEPPPTKPLPGMTLEQEKAILDRVRNNPHKKFQGFLNQLQNQPTRPNLTHGHPAPKTTPQLLPPANSVDDASVEEISPVIVDKDDSSIPTTTSEQSSVSAADDGYQSGRVYLDHDPEFTAEHLEETEADPLMSSGRSLDAPQSLMPPDLPGAEEASSSMLPGRKLLPSLDQMYHHDDDDPHSHGDDPYSHGDDPYSHGDDPYSHGESVNLDNDPVIEHTPDVLDRISIGSYCAVAPSEPDGS